jgi:hypothetical protein
VDFLQRHHAALGGLTIGRLKKRKLSRIKPDQRRTIMSQPNTQSDLREELRSAPIEPLLPIEKKLIVWSLSIGLVLLVVLAAVNHFFPATP